MQAIAEAAPPRLQALVLLAAGCGLRSAELPGLTVERVDFPRCEVRVDRHLVFVPGQLSFMGPLKTAESRRTVPLPAFAVDAAAAHLAAHPAGDDGLVFQADQGAPVLRTTFAGRWQQTLKRAGLTSTVHLHHPRDGYASLLNGAGVPFTRVMELLGHAPQGVT